MTVVRRPPPTTYVKTEGALGHWGEFASTTLDDVWGRLEKFYQDRQGVDSAELDELAERIVNRPDATTAARKVTVADPVHLPWTSYEPGDIVTLNLAPKDVKRELRVAAITVAMGPNQAAPKYDVHFGSPVYSDEAAMAQGLRTLLREFRKPTPTPHTDGTPQPAVPVSGGSAPTLVIAASNSPDSTKAKADYICFGVDDHLMFQLAIQRMQDGHGGRLVVCEGDYYFSDTCHILGAIRIEGMGVTASRLHMASGSNATMFKMVSPYVGSVEFVGIDLDGHDDLQSSGTWAGIHVQANSSAGQLILDTVHIHDFRGYGVLSDRSAITCTVDSSQIFNNTLYGLYLFVEGLFIVANNRIYGNGQYGVKADGAQMILTGNRIHDNGSDGFSAGGIFQGSGVVIVNNQFIDNGGNGVLLEGYNSVIAGNFATGNAGNGIQAGAIAGNPLTVTGNVALDNTLVGFYLHGNGGGTASGNVSNLNGQHGILIVDDHWLVQGNRVESNGRTTNNTYDGIQFAGTAGDSSALSNQVRQATGGNAQRYGINVVAGATNSWVAGNDVRGTYGTGAYVDAGTGTVNVWAGTFGDNY